MLAIWLSCSNGKTAATSEMSSNVSSTPATRPVHGSDAHCSSRRVYLLYHEISSAPGKYRYATDQESFRRHLNLFALARRNHVGSLWPELTFDDGHVSNLDYALPLLSEFNISAQFFITVGWTSDRPGYLTWEQLAALQRAGQKIGAHGWSHKLLTHCTDQQLQVELGDARLKLEDKLGVAITTMSLPGGRMNRRVLDACRRAGYEQIFTSVPRAEISDNVTLVGRVNVYSDTTTEWLQDLLSPGSNVIQRMERQYRLKQAVQSALGDRLYGKLWAILNRADPGAEAN